MKYFIILMLFCSSVQGKAFKCNVHGKIEYKQTPCLSGKTEAVFITEQDVIKEQAERKRKNRKYADKEIINKQFSVWDGSHRKLEVMVKKTMKDPSSFDHVSTKYWDNGDNTLSVLMRYRGKNSFGAIVIETIKVKADVDTGEVLSVIK